MLLNFLVMWLIALFISLLGRGFYIVYEWYERELGLSYLLDGSVLQVEFYGPADGQSIILTHGWGSNSTVWYYVRQLGDRCRVIWDLSLVSKAFNTPMYPN